MSLRGLLSAALALIALEVVTSTPQAAGRLGSLLEAIATGSKYLLDPTIPGVPDLAGVGSTPTPTPTPSAPPPDGYAGGGGGGGGSW